MDFVPSSSSLLEERSELVEEILQQREAEAEAAAAAAPGHGAPPIHQFLELRAEDYDPSGHGIGYMPPLGSLPLTRTFLASYYDRYPYSPRLPSDVRSRIRNLSSELLSQLPPNEGEKVLVEEADQSPPHKIDENLWKIRQCLEEVNFLFGKPWPPAEIAMFGTIPTAFPVIFKSLVSLQDVTSVLALSTVADYLPQDSRGALIIQQWERYESNKQAEVDAVVNSGGTIRDRYALLWKHQMDRRRQLAQLGSATGASKKYLVGIPQVLLDFVKQINDDDGPMEEQRRRYGPPLYSLTSMVLSIRLFLALYWRRFETRKLERDEVDVLKKAVGIYIKEFERFLVFFSGVFTNSPFFISAAEDGATESSNNEDFKEISIAAGKTHEVSLTVDSLNSYIAWDFSLVQGKMNLDIGFSVECISPSGQKSLVLPYRRYEADQGNLCTSVTGNYKLIWDNSYSAILEKPLRYKVDCIPPFEEPVQATPEVE